MNDRIFAPNKENDDPNGQKYFRFYHLMDFGYCPKHNWNIQLSYNDFRDLDMYREFNQILTDRVYSAETGIDAFAYWRNHWSEMNLQLLVPNSLLRPDESSDRNVMDRDPKAVATLPKLSWDFPARQFKWSNGAFFPQIVAKVDMETARFAQNYAHAETTIRNAGKIGDQSPTKFFWWHGDVFELSSTLNQDYAYYNFRNDTLDDFRKMQLRSKSTFSFEVAKIYGVASVRTGTLVNENNLLQETNERHRGEKEK